MPVTERQTFYGSTYMMYSKESNSLRQKAKFWVPGSGGGENWGLMGKSFSFTNSHGDVLW